MGDSVQDNLPRRGLRPLNCILLGVAVQENVQFRRLGNPTAIEFAIELDCELHSHSVARTADGTLQPGRRRRVPDPDFRPASFSAHRRVGRGTTKCEGIRPETGRL